MEYCLVNMFNVSFLGIEGEVMLMGLDLFGVFVFFGFVCMVGLLDFSYVLMVMGVGDEVVRGVVCFSVGAHIREEDVE